ncbi:MAG: hypothetical protein ACOVNU_01560 [Candidatus Kapaibacteriota bacterium]|jgi:hypothetical protein
MSQKTLEEIEKLRLKVSPITFLEELAQGGYLYEYVLKFLKNDFEQNEQFRIEVLELLYKYSSIPILELDVYFLEKLNDILLVFLNKIQK